jgi:hypothetical protein
MYWPTQMLIYRRGVAIGSLLTGLASSACAQQAQPRPSRRFGDTPLIRSWARAYHCPTSASKLAPIQVNPDSDFSPAEACAVAWRAREAWMRATNLRDTRIDPRNTLPITGILIDHPRYLVVRESRTTRADEGYTVTFYRGPATAVIVGFRQNADAGVVGPGHPAVAEPGQTPGRP